MSAALAIARREVRERRHLLAAAALLSLFALSLHVARAPQWAREAASLVLFFQLPTIAALAVGGSLISRDVVTGRLSFYFSRPVSAGALWAGKFLGGAAVVLAVFLCVSIPVGLATGGPSPRGGAFLLVFLLFLMTTTHAVTTMFRSASRLLAVDLALAAAIVVLSLVQIRHLAASGAGRVLAEGIPLAVAWGAAAMLASAAVQVAFGRADAHRGHLALSASLWTLAFLSLGVFALWGRWLLGVTPTDTGGVGHPLIAAPSGSAVLFKGASPQGRSGYSPVFLMDGESGAYVRLAAERATPPAFSRDGRTAAWIERAVPWWWYTAPYAPPDAFGEAWASGAAGAAYRGEELAVARFGGAIPSIEKRRLRVPEAVTAVLAVDGDGRRAVVSSRSSVFFLDAGRAEVVAEAEVRSVVAADVLSTGAVRLYRVEAGRRGESLAVLDWIPGEGSPVEKARVTGVRLGLLARRGDLAVVSTGAEGRAILDAARGAFRALSAGRRDVPGAALVLSNGGVALTLGDEVRIVTREGATVASMPVEAGVRVVALREAVPGEVAVGLWAASLARRRTVVLDAATGAVRRAESGLLPAAASWSSLPQPEPGSFASRLFRDSEGALVALEPDGRRRVIVAAREE